MRTMDIHQVRDGKIVTTWHLEDFAGLMAQLTAPADSLPIRPGPEQRLRHHGMPEETGMKGH